MSDWAEGVINLKTLRIGLGKNRFKKGRYITYSTEVVNLGMWHSAVY